ncbi:MAG: hypothetical protein WDM85_07745 [Caulobacteraceae bacterium]
MSDADDLNEWFTIYTRATDNAFLVVRRSLNLDLWHGRPPEINPNDWKRVLDVTGDKLSDEQRSEVRSSKGYCIYSVS